MNLTYQSRLELPRHTSVSQRSLGQVWADFIHKTDKLVVLAEGEIEIEI